ncbi:MAG: outer membrane protein assembly factor [Candidatus Syntrophosphaera sp.]|nr:outer membrane protein assembly factor [Candidatus Syntrophosphaera sp.]
MDYDKWINSKYFPADYDADSGDPEIFTKEPLDVSLLLTHPFNRYLNGQIGAQFSHVSLYNFGEAPTLQQDLQDKDTETAYLSNIINLRWDTLNSAKNPSRGFYLKHELETNWLHDQLRGDAENERRDPLSFTWGRKFSFLRNTTTARYYTVLWYPKTVLALRLQGKYQSGGDIPFQFKLPLGGGTSLRGTSSGRYLDDTVVVANAEIRFPIYKGLGGILGYDAGAAAHSPEQLALKDLVSNPVVGLRYYMSDFIVRLDVGLGEEGMGLYFNFGHAF